MNQKTNRKSRLASGKDNC